MNMIDIDVLMFSLGLTGIFFVIFDKEITDFVNLIEDKIQEVIDKWK